MRVLVVFCHPVPESFGAAVRDAAVAGLTDAGHEVRLIDLYAEGFDPVMRADERRGYHDETVNRAPVADHLARLAWCEGLVFVTPIWWYGPPAMLKGWLDRVWVPGATFLMPKKGEPIRGVLKNIRFLGAVTTHGSPWAWWRFVMGEPGRRILIRGLRPLIAARARTLWLALHEMDTRTAAEREAFLATVRAKLARVQ